jgi:hypothetical protein
MYIFLYSQMFFCDFFNSTIKKVLNKTDISLPEIYVNKLY